MNTAVRNMLAAIAVIVLGAAGAPAQDEKIDLTGTWAGDGGGVYHVRQDGNSVWWVAMSDDGGKSWTHVFHGKLGKNEVVGEWADVPNGATNLASGSLTLALQLDKGKVVGLTKVRQRGDEFGNKTWKRKP